MLPSKRGLRWGCAGAIGNAKGCAGDGGLGGSQVIQKAVFAQLQQRRSQLGHHRHQLPLRLRQAPPRDVGGAGRLLLRLGQHRQTVAAPSDQLCVPQHLQSIPLMSQYNDGCHQSCRDRCQHSFRELAHQFSHGRIQLSPGWQLSAFPLKRCWYLGL